MVVRASSTGRFLLIERSPQPGMWQSVTGSLELGESPAQTAQRELFEELGIYASPLATGLSRQFEIMSAWRDRYAPGVNRNTEYEFRLPVEDEFTPQLSPAEHRDFVWLDSEAAAKKVFSWTNKLAIEQWPAAEIN